MFVDSYQVEMRSFVTEKWAVNRCFRLHYKWRRIIRYILGFLKLIRQEIVDDAHVQVLIAKSDAYQHALSLSKCPRFVRITRIERKGARLMKFVIWQDGKWLE